MMNRIVSGLLITLFAISASWADTNPTEGVVNYESPHVHPIDLTPDQNTLLAVNTAGHRLEIYDVSNGGVTFQGFVPVGIDPVSVRARSNTEAWVVNHISDSVSIVDISNRTVIRTLSTANEPADVVFAGSPQRAFVTASEANSVQVFNLSNLNASPTTIGIVGEDPRALAVSPDGNTVYAAIFESGNGTTSLSGGEGVLAGNAVSRPEGPYGGVNPPPNDGNSFNPPINPAIGTPPRSAIIVRKDAQNRWMDGNNGDWSLFVSGELATVSQRVVGWDLPDNDVAIINANTLAVSYQKRLMNIAMAIGVNPASGQVSVVGTDATNEIRFEPNLNGNFLRVNLAQFNPGNAASIRDLNPHLDYRQATASIAVRNQSIGDPRAIAWNGNGTLALVSGMGSNNLIALDAQGNRVGRIEVEEGPTGVVIQDGQARAFVMNKFAGNISTVSLDPFSQTTVTAFDDPTPDVIKEGRKFLYDTHLTSGNGHMSCASCHVDARTDRLAWDLGNPAGSEATVATASRLTGESNGGTATLSPIKGPMLTQTLQDIMLNPKMHWRGDKDNLNDFSPTFTDLMGNPQAMSGVDMMAMGDFLNTIHLPPNPYRNIDNSRPQTIVMPDGLVAQTTADFNTLRGNSNLGQFDNCLGCHLQSGTRSGFTHNERQQSIIPPNFAMLYERLGYWPKSSGESTSGFGFFHSGSDSLAVSARVDAFNFQTDMLAELMTLEGPGGPLAGGERRQDTHAGVGRQLTVSGSPSNTQSTLLNQLVSIGSSSPYASLVANGIVSGVLRGFSLQSNGRFQSDRSSEQRSLQELLSFAANGQPITFTLVANGTEARMSTDRDNNGVLDGDETSNPPVANPDSVNVTSSATVTINPLSNDTGSDLVLQAPNVWSLNGGNVLASGNLLRYTPRLGYNGQDTIYYAISDPAGNGSWSQINIVVSGNNNSDVPPQANPDVVSVTSSATVTIQPLANDTGSSLVLQAPNVWSLNGGNVLLSGNSLRYTPAAGFNGQDTIYYTITGTLGRGSWSQINITVSGNNNVAAVANPDTISVTSSATVTIQPLNNDLGSGLVLQAPNVWSLQGGIVVTSGNSLSYTPKPGFNGEDKIYYSIMDGQSRSSWSSITLAVSGNGGSVDVPVVANPDAVTVGSSATVTIRPLSNDTGSGLVLQAPNVWSMNGGNVALLGNTLRYTPGSGFNGTDRIYYSVVDSQGRGSWSVIVISVSGN